MYCTMYIVLNRCFLQTREMWKETYFKCQLCRNDTTRSQFFLPWTIFVFKCTVYSEVPGDYSYFILKKYHKKYSFGGKIAGEI